MALLQQAKDFFEKMNTNENALSTLKYNSVLHIKTKDRSILVTIKDFRIAEVREGEAPVTDMDFVFESDEDIFAKIFNGELTVGQASWNARLRMVDFGARRGHIVALNRAILKTQKTLYPQLPS